jgi:membrane protease YdiL (CAAX protease family)
MERAAPTLLIPRRTSAFRQVPWRWWHVAVGLAPLLGLLVLQQVTAAGWLPRPPRSLSLPLTVLDQLWMLGWTLFVARRYGRVPRAPDAEGALVEAVVAVPAWVAMFITLIMIVVAYIVAFGRFEPPVNPFEKLSGQVSHFELICLALVAVLLAPVCEETFFRGMLYNALRRRLPIWVAIPIQGLVFGFLHSFNLTHSLLTSVLGMFLGLVYEWRRTLVTSMFVHAIQNSVAMLFTAILLGLAADTATLGVVGEPGDGGLRLAAVFTGSAADEAGLREGDVITTIDGQPVADGPALVDLMKAKRPANVVAIEYRRDGELHQVQATLKRKGW